VIFGATGSLARLKLFPALYDLTVDGHTEHMSKVIGLARSPMSNEAFRELARQSVQLNARNEYDQDRSQELARRLQFVVLDDDGYVQLKNGLKEEERLVFLAIPPSAFGSTARALAKHDLTRGARLLVEKPFGRDLESAIQLDSELRDVLDESQIFRIDH